MSVGDAHKVETAASFCTIGSSGVVPIKVIGGIDCCWSVVADSVIVIIIPLGIIGISSVIIVIGIVFVLSIIVVSGLVIVLRIIGGCINVAVIIIKGFISG